VRPVDDSRDFSPQSYQMNIVVYQRMIAQHESVARELLDRWEADARCELHSRDLQEVHARTDRQHVSVELVRGPRPLHVHESTKRASA
jgi:transposase-like protein